MNEALVCKCRKLVDLMTTKRVPMVDRMIYVNGSWHKAIATSARSPQKKRHD